MLGSSEPASESRCVCNVVGDVNVNADEGGCGADCDCVVVVIDDDDDDDWRAESMAA
jgi:hypothetical protein